VTSSNNCSRDSLVVTDGVTGQQFYTLCGHDIPGDVTSSSNKLSLVFSTSNYHNSSKNGFVVTYTSRQVIPGKCSLKYRHPLVILNIVINLLHQCRCMCAHVRVFVCVYVRLSMLLCKRAGVL